MGWATLPLAAWTWLTFKLISFNNQDSCELNIGCPPYNAVGKPNHPSCVFKAVSMPTPCGYLQRIFRAMPEIY